MNRPANRNALLLVLIASVVILGAGAAATTQPGGATTRSATQPRTQPNGLLEVPDEMALDMWLRRFHLVFHATGERPDEKLVILATGIADAIKVRLDQHKIEGDGMDYYLAECLLTMGRPGEAAMLAGPVARDPLHPLYAEAVRLTARIEIKLASTQPDLHAVWSRAHRAIAVKCPCGWYADFLLPDDSKLPTTRRFLVTDEQVGPTQAVEDAVAAARLYAQMGDQDRCIHMYQRAVGFHYEGYWMTRQEDDIWMHIGDAYRAKGNWRLGLTYYRKAVACGRFDHEIIGRFKEMEKNLAEQVVAKPEKKEPDAGTLTKIAGLCLKTDLFEDALSALDDADALTPTPNRALRAEIHRTKADVMKQIIECYGVGGTLRGTVVTTQAAEQEERLGREAATQPGT